jgi:hypothetical protein
MLIMVQATTRLVVALLLVAFDVSAMRAQPGESPKHYARIAILRPRSTVDFEAGYARHLAWHQQARDPFVWYGWTVTFADRQRWFIYATFGHSAADFDNAVAPADDERDNVLNVVPHADFLGNAFYEYLPALSKGSPVPSPAPRVEFTTVEIKPGVSGDFEAALRSQQTRLQSETLWFRMVAGGSVPRYVRLRPRASLSAILDARTDQPLSAFEHLVTATTVEILTLRPSMSLGLAIPARH